MDVAFSIKYALLLVATLTSFYNFTEGVTITRLDNGFRVSNTISVLEIGVTHVFICEELNTKWYFQNGTIVPLDSPSNNVYQIEGPSGSGSQIVFNPFIPTSQDYYSCVQVVDGNVRTAFLGAFISSHLNPTNVQINSDPEKGQIILTWAVETGLYPVTRFIIRDVKNATGVAFPKTTTIGGLYYKDILGNGPQVQFTIFEITAVYFGFYHPTTISAVIVGPPLKVEAVPMKNDTIVTVSWEPIENPIPSIVIISGYAVEYKKSDDSLYIIYGSVEESNIEIRELFRNTKYDFRVRALTISNSTLSVLPAFPSNVVSIITSNVGKDDPDEKEPMRGPNNASSSLRNPQSSGGVTAAAVIAILILIIAIWAGLIFLLAILIRRNQRSRDLVTTIRRFKESPSLQRKNEAERKKLVLKNIINDGHLPSSSACLKRIPASISLKSLLKGGATIEINSEMEDSVSTVKTDDLDHLNSRENSRDREYANVIPLSPPNEDADHSIDIVTFPDYVKSMHNQRQEGFEKEYEILCKESHAVPFTAHGSKANRNKNRFNNIFSFDHSRVVLSKCDHEGSDYINASFISGYNRPKAYISTQGPTEETISDFWQMIWDQRPPVIVMLTKLEEKGRRKCERYWSEEDDVPYSVHDRQLTITMNAFKLYAECEVRVFTIKNLLEPEVPPHQVYHFLFIGWPDHGVPAHPSSLIRFIHRVRTIHRDHISPMLVHCSAGVGRSGTFIAIDAMMQRLKGVKSVDVYNFVKDMRKRRTHMVQTLDQYVFIHDALFDYIACGDTSVPTSKLRDKLKQLKSINSGKGTSQLTDEFTLLNTVCMSPTEDDKQFSKRVLVARKNRYPDRYPYSQKYLYLMGKGGTLGSEYTNASLVNGYCNNAEFIAAQAPLSQTVNDLWQLIWQFKPSTIVTLCTLQEDGKESCHVFWPEEERRYSHVIVKTTSIVHRSDYMIYKMAISDGRRQTVPHEITHFHYQAWPKKGRPKCLSLLHLIDAIQKSKKYDQKPTMVLCNDGMNRTGTFICIYSEVEHLRLEGTVDVFQSVKIARCKRPHLVTTEENYLFCYEALSKFVDTFEDYANFKNI